MSARDIIAACQRAVSFWDEAPPDADRVRMAFNGQVAEEPIANGVYLVVFWRQPALAGGPTSTSFRVRGQWVETLSVAADSRRE